MKINNKEISSSFENLKIVTSNEWNGSVLRKLRVSAKLDPKSFENKFICFKIPLFKLKIVTSTLTAAVLLVLSGGVAMASNSSKPGDFLFPIDKLTENIQRKLTFNVADRVALEKRIQIERTIENSGVNDDKNVASVNDTIDSQSENRPEQVDAVADQTNTVITQTEDINKTSVVQNIETKSAGRVTIIPKNPLDLVHKEVNTIEKVVEVDKSISVLPTTKTIPTIASGHASTSPSEDTTKILDSKADHKASIGR